MIEVGFVLVLIGLAYGIGAGAGALVLKMIGHPLAATHASLLVLALPLITALTAEGFTRLWEGTPGTLGLGSFNVVFPMLTAGAISLAAAFGAQQLIAPFDPQLPRASESSVTAWVVLAALCSLVALALWRFWPEPRARLF